MKKKTKNKKQKNITQKKTKKASLESFLQSVYHDKINLETKCNHQCECCNVACPSMNYCEFVQIITGVWKNTTDTEKLDLLIKSIEYFFRNGYEKWGKKSLIKPCLLLDNSEKLCKIYKDRPLSCFLPETFVFTKVGPKKIKDIMAGDFVYGMDGKVHRVIATNSKMHNGYVYNIKTQGNCFDNWCTEEHLWLTTFQKDKRKTPEAKWVMAKDIISKKCKIDGHYTSFPNKWEKRSKLTAIDLSEYVDGIYSENKISPFTSGKIFEGYNYQTIPRFVDIDEEFLFMFGIYLAEGSSSQQSVSFCMNTEEQKYLDRIKIYLQDKWGIQSHYNKVKRGKNVLVLRVDSCLFARFMKRIGGSLAQGKRICDEIFGTASFYQLMKIFEAWDVGDGRKCFREREYSVTTISEELACQMQMILMFNEIYPQVYLSDNGCRKTSYDVHVFPSNFRECNDGQGTKRMYDENYCYNPSFETKTKPYYGPVFDIQVDDSESFITPSGIVHNCRMYGLWPKEAYKRRVDKFEKAYSKFGLKREDLPLHEQCPFVRRVEESIPITSENIEGLFNQLDDMDKTIGGYSKLQISQKENYRTFHDWLLLKVFGEDWLVKLTTFMMAASAETIDEQIKAIVKVWTETFMKNGFPDIIKEL